MNLRFPGHGLPIEHSNYHHWQDDEFGRLTAREITMLRMMNEITDKPEWHRKVFYDDIVSRWREEAKANDMSDAMFDWCIAELQEKAEKYSELGLVEVLDTYSAVVKADGLVDAETTAKLKEALEELRNSMEDDWHPGSNLQVLDLVHPSLCPLVYGRTRLREEPIVLHDTLQSFGDGHILAKLAPTEAPTSVGQWGRHREFSKWSFSFQWLPCEIEIDNEREGSTPTMRNLTTEPDGNSCLAPEEATAIFLRTPIAANHVRISSYINNLHPVKHSTVYALLETLIGRSIPLWNACLRPDTQKRLKRIECNEAHYDPPAEYIHAGGDDRELYERVKEMAKPEGILELCRDAEWLEGHLEDDVSLEEWIASEPIGDWSIRNHVWEQKRKLVLPEPGEYKTSHKPWLSYEVRPDTEQPFNRRARRQRQQRPYQETTVNPTDLLKDFQTQGLQVIVKIASIQLTPDNPSYSGGSWHLEGLQNEHIIATSLFYYSTDNVTPSRLQFRQRAVVDNTDFNYEQDDHRGLETIYGLPDGGLRDAPMVQELGSVETKEGRLLAFPNVLQHRVEPFELVDKSAPGHRSFVALWLVDPHNRIISTRHVPPQRYDWWEDALRESTDIPARLPPELSDEVFKEGQRITMSREEAEAYRLELMAERTQYVQGVEGEWTEQTYNFCEH